MVASSHWTSKVNSFRQLVPFAPAAVTLKTTSARTGGDGSDGERDMRALVNQFNERFATYTDGPRTLELWDLATTSDLSRAAHDTLPSDTALGLSVLQHEEEDYTVIARDLDLSLFKYVELNWKYTFRNLGRDAASERAKLVVVDLGKFFAAFDGLPLFVKLPREFLEYMNEGFFWSILRTIDEARAGIIVANSLKTRVPPSRLTKSSTELVNGVVVGEHLFLQTYNAVRELALARSSHEVPPIVAAGGILDLGGAIDVMAAGANAVQLCSALDIGSPAILDQMRDDLTRLCREHGDFTALLTAARSSESEWAKLANGATNDARARHRRVGEALSDSRRVVEEVRGALLYEAVTTEPDLDVLRPGPPPALFGATIIVPRGNVLSYLAATRAAGDLHLNGVPLESSYLLRKGLSAGTVKYDFALLTRSALEYMVSHGTSGSEEREPSEVGPIGLSYVELVGDTRRGIDGIHAIHHFSGVTGRRALEQLLQTDLRAAPTYAIDSTKVLTTLLYLRPEVAILAKPPLSRLYGLLVPSDIAPHWGRLWECHEDIVLVARRGFRASEEGEQASRFLLEKLRALVKTVANDPGHAARSCMDGMYWSYFADLLGARITW